MVAQVLLAGLAARDSRRSRAARRSAAGSPSGRVCGTPATAKLPRVGARIVVSTRIGGRLAGAVRAEHAQDLARPHGKRQLLDGDERAVVLGDRRAPRQRASCAEACYDRQDERTMSGGRAVSAKTERIAVMRVLVVEDELRMASLIRRGLVKEGLAVDVAANGEDALWMAAAHRLRRDRARRHAARVRRLRDVPPARAKRRLGARADADRARLGRGPRRRPRHRRRRLPRQAVRVCRAARTSARACTPRRTRAAERARGRRPPARPGDARVWRGRDRDRALRQGVRAARDVHAPTRTRCSRACICSSTPGTSPTRTARTWSTSTSGTCAAKIDEPFGRRSLETVRGAGYRLRRDGGL